MGAPHFTDQDFDQNVLKANILSVVDFYADWCGPCKMMAPVLEGLAQELNGKVNIGKMDVDANQGIPGQYGISSIPTTIFFKDGKEVDRLVGYQSKDALMKKIEAHQ